MLALLMQPKDPIQYAQKTDIIYHWKCPAHTAQLIHMNPNRPPKKEFSDHRNQTTWAIRNHHISTKHPKAELKDFTIIDQRQQHPMPSSKRSTSHSNQRSITQQKILAKSESLQYSTNFSNLQTSRNSNIVLSPHPRGAPYLLSLSTLKNN